MAARSSEARLAKSHYEIRNNSFWRPAPLGRGSPSHIMKYETIVLGGGCFWCTEPVFRMIKGISSVVPGYAGGIMEHPAYEAVSGGKTNHAEVFKNEYDPAQVSYRDLLTVFFARHDPTELNQQGNDVGTQYRSIILYTNGTQKKEAEDFIKELNGTSDQGLPIVTEVKPLEKFYEAEDYHHDYYSKNKNKNPYCEVVINPKLKKVQEKFAELLN